MDSKWVAELALAKARYLDLKLAVMMVDWWDLKLVADWDCDLAMMKESRLAALTE